MTIFIQNYQYNQFIQNCLAMIKFHLQTDQNN